MRLSKSSHALRGRSGPSLPCAPPTTGAGLVHHLDHRSEDNTPGTAEPQDGGAWAHEDFKEQPLHAQHNFHVSEAGSPVSFKPLGLWCSAQP